MLFVSGVNVLVIPHFKPDALEMATKIGIIGTVPRTESLRRGRHELKGRPCPKSDLQSLVSELRCYTNLWAFSASYKEAYAFFPLGIQGYWWYFHTRARTTNQCSEAGNKSGEVRGERVEKDKVSVTCS